MKFDNPKYVERYEDVIFEPQTAVHAVVANGQHQEMKNFRFIADNTDEVTAFNWNRARLSVDFKVNLLADGANIAVDDHNGIVNGAHSLIMNLSVTINGKTLYDCNKANHCVNIKNMLEYSPAYAESLGTNEFFYVDTSRHAEERPAQANYNKGFAARKARLGTSSTVVTEITLNRYSFFERLEDELLPNTRVELKFETERDGNVIWRAGDDCRVIITRMQLIVPRITFNSEGQELFSLLKTPRNASARHAKGPIPLGNTSLVTLSVSTCIRGYLKDLSPTFGAFWRFRSPGNGVCFSRRRRSLFPSRITSTRTSAPELSLSFAELSTSFGQRQCGTRYPRTSRSRAELGCRKSTRGISSSAFASRQLSFFQLCFYEQYLVSRLSAWSRTVRSSALLLFIYSFARGAACRQRTLSRLPLVMLFYVPCFGI